MWLFQFKTKISIEKKYTNFPYKVILLHFPSFRGCMSRLISNAVEVLRSRSNLYYMYLNYVT